MIQNVIRSRTAILTGFIIVYVLLAVYVMARFSLASDLGDNYWKASLPSMVQGTAWRPFVYRALLPDLVGIIVDATPMEIKTAVGAALKNGTVAEMLGDGTRLHGIFLRGDHLYMRLVMMVLVYICLCGYVVVLYALGELFYPRQQAMALCMPIIGLLMIPAFVFNGLYLYDFAVLFLTAVCYYCMARQRWWQYLFWFLLACINKESAIFIGVFYALWNWRRLDIWTFWTMALLQGLIYIGVRLWLTARFMHNPGVILEYHPLRQMHALLMGYNFRILATDFFILFLALYRWRQKPLFARYILAISPFMLLAYLLFGYPGEYRVFYDLFPLLTVLVADTLVMGTDLYRFTLFTRGDVHVSLPLDQAASA